MSRLINIVLGVILPLLLLLGEVWLFQQPWEELSHPRIAAAVEQISKKSEILVLGNSVTATLDAASLSQESKRSVRKVYMEGSLPAHWAALLAQARIRYEIKPKKIVIYVVENNLFRTKLFDEEDVAMLKQLSPQYVEGLSEKALGITPSNTIFQNRIPLRERILDGMSRLPIQMLWSSAYGFIDHSVEEVFGGINPQRSERKSATPGQPIIRHEAKEASLEAPELSIFPLLQKEAEKLNATLFVVLPARSQPIPLKCENPDIPEKIEILIQQGVHVWDLRAIPMNKSHFSSLHHLSPRGAPIVSKWLAKGFKLEKKGLWIAGCEDVNR